MSALPDALHYRRVGRTIGVLLVLQIVVAPMVNFVTLRPMQTGPQVRMIFTMLLPLGLTHLVLAGWLLARGFEERKS